MRERKSGVRGKWGDAKGGIARVYARFYARRYAQFTLKLARFTLRAHLRSIYARGYAPFTESLGA